LLQPGGWNRTDAVGGAWGKDCPGLYHILISILEVGITIGERGNVEKTVVKGFGYPELDACVEGKVAKWQVPDDVMFVESIPLGATGKMLKNRLREQFKDYRLPGTG